MRLPRRWPLELRIIFPFGFFLGMAFFITNYLTLSELNTYREVLLKEELQLGRENVHYFEAIAQYNMHLAGTLVKNPRFLESLISNKEPEAFLNRQAILLSREAPFPYFVSFRQLENSSEAFWQLERQGDDLFLSGAAPVISGEKLLGFLVVSCRLKDVIHRLEHIAHFQAGLLLLDSDKRLKILKEVPFPVEEKLRKNLQYFLRQNQALKIGHQVVLLFPLRDAKGEVIGFFVRSTFSPSFYFSPYNLLKNNIFPTALLFGLALIVAIFFTRQYLCEPLRKFNDQLKEISRVIGKRLRQPVEESVLKVSGDDELANLARTINELVRELDELASFRQAIETDETPQEIYSRLARVIKKKFDFSNFVIFEVSNSQNRIEPVIVEPSCLLEECCYQEIEGRPALCRVLRRAIKASSLHFTETCEYFRDPDLNYLCLPLYTGGHVIGIIHFLLPITFRLEEKYRTILNRIEAYLQEAAPVLEAKRFAQSLREISLRDTLTGLYNRRILDDLVPQIAAGVVRRDSIMGVLMIDIDHFKIINDTYGHSFGDRILKSVASMVQDELRSSDLAIRFGGEEFLCLLVDVEEGISFAIAERIREKIETNSFVFEGQLAAVTVSIGVAEFPLDDRNLWNVISFADLALYRAKRQGRNQCVRFDRTFLLEEKPRVLNRRP